MEFSVAKFLWQIVNFSIFIGIIILVFIVPIRAFKRINAIESHLEQINRKLEILEANKKDTNEIEG